MRSGGAEGNKGGGGGWRLREGAADTLMREENVNHGMCCFLSLVLKLTEDVILPPRPPPHTDRLTHARHFSKGVPLSYICLYWGIKHLETSCHFYHFPLFPSVPRLEKLFIFIYQSLTPLREGKNCSVCNTLCVCGCVSACQGDVEQCCGLLWRDSDATGDSSDWE